MGKSEYIVDKCRDSEQFRQLINSLENDGAKERNRLQTEITAMAKKYYENHNWGFGRLGGDQRSDYLNLDDWDMSRIKAIIDSVGYAIKSAGLPSAAVVGSDQAQPSTISNTLANLSAFVNDYSVNMARIHAVFSQIATVLAVKTKQQASPVYRNIELSGGLNLFIGASGRSFSSAYSTQLIGSLQIVFNIYMSVPAAQQIDKQKIIQMMQLELDKLVNTMIDLKRDQASSLKEILKENPSYYMSAKIAYDAAMSVLANNRAILTQEYDRFKS